MYVCMLITKYTSALWLYTFNFAYVISPPTYIHTVLTLHTHYLHIHILSIHPSLITYIHTYIFVHTMNGCLNMCMCRRSMRGPVRSLVRRCPIHAAAMAATAEPARSEPRGHTADSSRGGRHRPRGAEAPDMTIMLLLMNEMMMMMMLVIAFFSACFASQGGRTGKDCIYVCMYV